MDFREVFYEIPDEFDKRKISNCDEVFDDIIQYAELGKGKSVLEIGPGIGQATAPILKTGCNYLAIELGEYLAEYNKVKFYEYNNFSVINDDFITHDFGEERFDF